ncbi:TPA: autotransporter outer membrane beta-barrel domain-containing protein, partial [Campylobacter jejuni]
SNRNQAVNFQSGSSTTTFLNKGTINSNAGEAIYFNNTKINTFNNGGTISSTRGKGVSIDSGTTIDNFSNNGTISSYNYGVGIDSGATIDNFSNGGIIQSEYTAIYISNTKIQTLNNSGTIKGDGSYGVYIDSGASIEKFNNSGTIEGGDSHGVNIRNGAKIQTFTNSGTIQSSSYGAVFVQDEITTFENTGVINGNESGIVVQSNIKTLINSGTMYNKNTSVSDAGIKLELGTTIDNIINTGTIESGSYGIAVSYGKFGTLTIKNGGIVRGQFSGINVGRYQRLGDLYIDGTSLKKDGSVSGVYGGTYGILLSLGASTQKINLSNGGVIQGNIGGIKLDN